MKEVVIFFFIYLKKKKLFVLDGANVEHFSQAKSKKGRGGGGGVENCLKSHPDILGMRTCFTQIPGRHYF